MDSLELAWLLHYNKEKMLCRRPSWVHTYSPGNTASCSEQQPCTSWIFFFVLATYGLNKNSTFADLDFGGDYVTTYGVHTNKSSSNSNDGRKESSSKKKNKAATEKAQWDQNDFLTEQM